MVQYIRLLCLKKNILHKCHGQLKILIEIATRNCASLLYGLYQLVFINKQYSVTILETLLLMLRKFTTYIYHVSKGTPRYSVLSLDVENQD